MQHLEFDINTTKSNVDEILNNKGLSLKLIASFTRNKVETTIYALTSKNPKQKRNLYMSFSDGRVKQTNMNVDTLIRYLTWAAEDGSG